MADSGVIARRGMLKAAVFQPQAAAVNRTGAPAAARRGEPGRAAREFRSRPSASVPDLASAAERVSAPDHLYRAVTGTILDASPHVLTIGDSTGERRFVMTADATAWRGGPLEPSELQPGDEAVIRLVPSQAGTADRVWANIGRVCGTIVECDSDCLLVAEGATRKQQAVVIPPRARGRIRVRFPNLRPGYLVDIIGTRQQGVLYGLIPAAPQPPYRSDRVLPAQRPPGGRPPETITGSAVWHDSADEPYGVLGVFYPAVDPATGCVEDAAAGIGPGQAQSYRELPYLAVGSTLLIRNMCTDICLTLPVTGCAPTARLFNDRCLACRASLRGRVADLTLASFVALGGELESGCFNATLTIGR